MRISSDSSVIESTSRQHPPQSETSSVQIDELFELVVDKGATDLHLKVPSPPVLRIDGTLIRQEDLPPLTPEDIPLYNEARNKQEVPK